MSLTRDEAEVALKALLSREQQRLQRILKPYLQELTHVMARKPPKPVVRSDGMLMAYVGPIADTFAARYEAPRWLEELCREDPDLLHALACFHDRGEGA